MQSKVEKAQMRNPDKLTVIKTDTGEITLSSNIVKDYLIAGGGDVTNQEVKLFIALCSAHKLNPFIKEAHLIKYGSSPATMVVSKDVYQKRANKNPLYKGKKAGIIVVNNETREIIYREGMFYMKDHETLVGGWCEIYKHKNMMPERIEVSLDEYIGRKKDGTVNSQWSGKPATMIRKVAVAQALREAFTEDFQGMYIAEEFGEDSETLDSRPINEDNIINAAAVEKETAQAISETTSALKVENIVNQVQPEAMTEDIDPMSM